MTPLTRLAAITVDVDSSACYQRIHGIDGAPTSTPDPIFTRGVPRLMDWLKVRDLKGTFFVVGQDLARTEARDAVAALAAAGHEVASHSHRHDYALSTLPPDVIDADLEASRDALADVTGHAPAGFRAPGYNLSEALCDSIERAGFLYDSSVLPVPAYFAARAAILALYRMQGRASESLVGDPREFLATRAPFRPARNARYRPARRTEAARAYVELPMGTTAGLRAPWIGTSLTALPLAAGRALTAWVLRAAVPAVLELHAIDACDVEDGFAAGVAAQQRDLRIAVRDKQARLGATFDAMMKRRHVEPLAEIAARVA